MQDFDKHTANLSEILKLVDSARKHLTELCPDQAGTWGAWSKDITKKIGDTLTHQRPPFSETTIKLESFIHQGLTKEEIKQVGDWLKGDDAIIMDVMTPDPQAEILYHQFYVIDLIDFINGTTLEGRFDEELDKDTQTVLKKLVSVLPKEAYLITIDE